MAEMSPPHSGAVVDVRKEDVDRYAEAGWTKVSGGAKKSTTSKSSSSKSKK